MNNNLINKNTSIIEIHDENRKIEKNKINFLKKKENTICSLFEVEHFLCNFKKIINTAKLYKILK